jgi:hypothetical protein
MRSKKSNILVRLSARNPGKHLPSFQTSPSLRSDSRMVNWIVGLISRYLFCLCTKNGLNGYRKIEADVFAATNLAHPAPITATHLGVLLMMYPA